MCLGLCKKKRRIQIEPAKSYIHIDMNKPNVDLLLNALKKKKIDRELNRLK